MPFRPAPKALRRNTEGINPANKAIHTVLTPPPYENAIFSEIFGFFQKIFVKSIYFFLIYDMIYIQTEKYREKFFLKFRYRHF